MAPYFSIIIPVYNVAPYLRECLDSVLAQTFTDWEAICVDDGSTDGSGAILDEYAARDSRFRVIHQSNAGVSAARNAALDVVKGSWILFLDGDDVWSLALLSIVDTMIKAHPNAKLFRFSSKSFSDNFRVQDYEHKGDCYAVTDISKEISMHDFFFFFFFCYAYHKDLFVGIRFPGYIHGEDRYVLNRIQLELADSIVSTEAPLYGYRQRKGSALNSIPSFQALCDEMDYRLDIMEMIDSSHKRVVYAGSRWLEWYFTNAHPMISFGLTRDKSALRRAMYVRLPRILALKGLSRKGRSLLLMADSIFMRPVIYLIYPTIQILHNRLGTIKPIARLYRRIMRHGEFAG